MTKNSNSKLLKSSGFNKIFSLSNFEMNEIFSLVPDLKCHFERPMPEISHSICKLDIKENEIFKIKAKFTCLMENLDAFLYYL